MKLMKFFNFEMDHFSLTMEFNFRTFSRLILIRISIGVQLIDWCHLL